MAVPAILAGAARLVAGGGRAAGAGGRGSATLRGQLRSRLRSKIGNIAQEELSDIKGKVSLDVVLFIDPRFVQDLEGSVKKSMDRSGTLWARGMRRDMASSGTDGRRSKPGKAPAIQSTALAMSIGHKHDKPNSGRTKFKMYVGSVGRQRLRRVPKEKGGGDTFADWKKHWKKKSNASKLKSMISRARKAIGSFSRGVKRAMMGRRRGSWSPSGGLPKATKAAMAQRALPHQYGYWLEYGDKRFNVPFKARPWAGPGSSTHNLWVKGRYFLQDFREGMQKHLRKYLR